MTDTTTEAEAVVRSAIFRATPVERVRQALELSEQMRTVSLVRLRAQLPDRSTLELVELLLGESLVDPAPRIRQSPA